LIAARIEEGSENGPQPTRFFALYLNRCYLPLITRVVLSTTKNVLIELLAKPDRLVNTPEIPSSIYNS